jgi:hypothetical protein
MGGDYWAEVNKNGLFVTKNYATILLYSSSKLFLKEYFTAFW